MRDEWTAGGAMAAVDELSVFKILEIKKVKSGLVRSGEFDDSPSVFSAHGPWHPVP